MRRSRRWDRSWPISGRTTRERAPAFINLHESGSFPAFLDEWLAAFGMPARTSRTTPSSDGGTRRQPRELRRRVAGAEFRVRLGSSCRSARISWRAGAPTCRSSSPGRTRAAKLDRRAAVHLYRRASIAHGTQRRPVASRQARLGASDRERAARAPGSRDGHDDGAGGDGERSRRGGADAIGQRAGCGEAQPRPGRWQRRPMRWSWHARSMRSIRRRATSGPRSIPRTHCTEVRTCRDVCGVSALVDRMNRGAVPTALRARGEPRLHDAQGAGLCRRDGQGAVQGELLELSGRDRGDVRSRAAGPSCDSRVGATRRPRSVCARSSSRGWIRCSTRARPRMCSSTLAKSGSGGGREVPVAGLSHLADQPLLRSGAAAFANALTTAVVQEAADHAAAAPRAMRAPARAAATPAAAQRDRCRPKPERPSSRRTATFISSCIRLRRLGDGRGANKPWLQEMPDPVTKTVWQTVVEIHPRRRRALA